MTQRVWVRLRNVIDSRQVILNCFHIPATKFNHNNHHIDGKQRIPTNHQLSCYNSQ